jgi:hypothetical protein
MKSINVKTLLSDRRISKSPSIERKHESQVRKPKQEEKDKKKKENPKR